MGRMEDIEIWEVFYWSLNSTLSSGLRCFGLICLIWAGHYLSSSLGPTFSVFCPDWPHMIDAEKNPPRHLPILYWLRHWPTTRGFTGIFYFSSPGDQSLENYIIKWLSLGSRAIFYNIMMVSDTSLSIAIQLARRRRPVYGLFQGVFPPIPEFGYFVNILTLLDSLMVYKHRSRVYFQPSE